MLVHAVVAALVLRFVFPRSSAPRRRRLMGWWSAKVLRILNVTVRLEGSPPALAESATMIAANHISWLDIFLIASLRPARFIAKSEVRDWPIAGWIAERAGTLFIRRARRHDTARINDLVRCALAEGDCVALFPEGTTTEGDRILKFHSS
ncbi:MAG TPA: lysophospholipid acyltransferase family protein, partial [Usitatibacter sp.]|nr:lysophospholipid acyltransferase family protein [Usitatibacter sp.]